MHFGSSKERKQLELGPVQCKRIHIFHLVLFHTEMQEIRLEGRSVFERGKGNVCSVEVSVHTIAIRYGTKVIELVQLPVSLACHHQRTGRTMGRPSFQ